MFKKDAGEIIEDVLIKAIRPGMTLNEASEAARSAILPLIEDRQAFSMTIEAKNPDYPNDGFTVKIHEATYR